MSFGSKFKTGFKVYACDKTRNLSVRPSKATINRLSIDEKLGKLGLGKKR